MSNEARRAEIKRFYRVARTNVDKTQLEVEALARLDTGRFWKIENAVVYPTPSERKALARVLRVNEADIPTNAVEAKAS